MLAPRASAGVSALCGAVRDCDGRVLCGGLVLGRPGDKTLELRPLLLHLLLLRLRLSLLVLLELTPQVDGAGPRIPR